MDEMQIFVSLQVDFHSGTSMLGVQFLYKNIFQHVGFIMDDNRTWVRNNSLPQLKGHLRGYENAKSEHIYLIFIN